MERESFEDEATADILRRHFVSIKVDREERPDIDKVYMSYVQASQGGGGWPMSVFLSACLRLPAPLGCAKGTAAPNSDDCTALQPPTWSPSLAGPTSLPRTSTAVPGSSRY